MNYRSRSSLAILAGMSLAACTEDEQQVVFVGHERYVSSQCWFDRKGEFRAFLVLAREGRIAVPYPISTTCMMDGGYTSLGEGVIHSLGLVELEDRFGILQRAFPDIVISDNSRTHQPTPTSDSRVYYFRARLTTAPDPHVTIYTMERLIELTDTNVSFESFLGLSREGRESLLRDHSPASR